MYSLILWLERKTKGLKHMDCIPCSGIGFFRTLSNLSQEAFQKIEQFVVFMYEKNSTMSTVNAARQKLFSQQCKAVLPIMQSHWEHAPPTEDYLCQHTLRAANQACLGPVSPQSTKVAISICLGMDQGWRTTTEAAVDNALPGWGLMLWTDPLWLQTRL